MRKKTILISILSLFFIFSGITSLAFEIYSFLKLDILNSEIIYWIVYRSIFDSMLFIIGIGIWFGKTWSWWLAIFFFLHVIMRETLKLSFPLEPKQAVGFIFPIIMILILLNKNVIQYLKIDFSNRLKKLFIFSILSAIVFSIFPGIYELGLLH
ncbi:hypothetical protein [Sulfurimonas hydrogeniphila]|uniref:hypothetical protein n=1 Tax=Sulfurimonas hydrogeniphila TaxID=2509341 RepID=UPI001260045B|nr:hypothetical protein [Sulfurimonas hydrogeniphila]